MIGHRTFVLCLALAAGACAAPNTEFCDAVTPCADPLRPFCDVNGQYAASQGVAHVCIAEPGMDVPSDPSFPQIFITCPGPSCPNEKKLTREATIRIAGTANGGTPPLVVIVNNDDTRPIPVVGTEWSIVHPLALQGTCQNSPYGTNPIRVQAKGADGKTSGIASITIEYDPCPPTLTVVDNLMYDERGYKAVFLAANAYQPCLVKPQDINVAMRTTVGAGAPEPTIYKYAINVVPRASLPFPPGCMGAIPSDYPPGYVVDAEENAPPSSPPAHYADSRNVIKWTLRMAENKTTAPVTVTVTAPGGVTNPPFAVAPLVTPLPNGVTHVIAIDSATVPQLATVEGQYQILVTGADAAGNASNNLSLTFNLKLLGGPVYVADGLDQIIGVGGILDPRSSTVGLTLNRPFAALDRDPVAKRYVRKFRVYNGTSRPAEVTFGLASATPMSIQTTFRLRHLGAGPQSCNPDTSTVPLCDATPPDDVQSASNLTVATEAIWEGGNGAIPAMSAKDVYVVSGPYGVYERWYAGPPADFQYAALRKLYGVGTGTCWMTVALVGACGQDDFYYQETTPTRYVQAASVSINSPLVVRVKAPDVAGASLFSNDAQMSVPAATYSYASTEDTAVPLP